jgi:hypothetical protein
MMNNRLLAMMVVVFAASGCSGDKAGGAAPSMARAPAAAAEEAVAAVLQSGGAPVAKLGFVVVARPVVGAQSDLRLELSTVAAIPALQIHVQADSFAIDPATAQAQVAIDEGKTASHLVKLTPQRAGLAEVTVRLRGADSAETVYVIPVLVAASAGGG